MRRLAATTLAKDARLKTVESGVEHQPHTQAEPIDKDELLVRAARSDLSSVGRLFDKYYDAIFRYIYHATFDKTLTEDLTSNVFVSAFSHLKRSIWRHVSFRAWLYRIATNEIRGHLRKKKSALVVLSRGNSTEEGWMPAFDVADFPVSARESLIEREEEQLLRDALFDLKPKYQAVIVLKYFEDKSIAEISQILGKRQGTIKSQLHRGLAQLQDIMTKRGVFREEAGANNG